MGPVTMAFITRCCTSALPSRRLLVWLLTCCLGLVGVARAENAELAALRVERADDGLFLTARVDFRLSPVVEDALHKGIAVHFVAEAEVMRERWYWYDQKAASAHRYMRVAYQPLTRRWRLNMATEPLQRTGLGVVLGQNFDALDEALVALQRVARWKIAEPGAVTLGSPYSVRLAFRLDTSQLARPFQIGALGSDGWNLAMDHRARVVVEAPP